MPFLDIVRVVLDEALGNRGAILNCRVELRRRQDAEQAVRQLCERIPPAATPTPASTPTPTPTESDDPYRASA